MLQPELFPLGTRVRVVGHWGFPDGTIGTIHEIPHFVHELRESEFWNPLYVEQKKRKGVDIIQWVEFDEPTDDGSGDGPYRASGFPVENLELVEDE